MNVNRRTGQTQYDLEGLAWDEMSIMPLETSSVIFRVIEVYHNGKNGAVEIELYTGTSK